ncbi:MAG: MFS transporter [Nitrospinae bacterium]|nr:MFS transporter [Nitrospinota bacterium]
MAADEPVFKYKWWAAGDVNAFFGLMLDNLTGLVILSSILTGIFKMPADVVLLKMVPGTALGVMLGDLAYTYMAFQLAKKERRQDVCAMPLGIDAIALFGLSLGVVGPAFAVTKDADKAWAVGMAVLVVMGAVKVVTAFFGEAVRRNVPRAALLGSLAALAVVFIAYLPFLKIISDPMAGLVSLGVILLTLTARVKLPLKIPGALAGVGLGTLVYYAADAFGLSEGRHVAEAGFAFAFPNPTLHFMDGLSMGLNYLPLSIPIAISSIIGGIDNTESAAVAGDKYDTRDILLVEGVATLVAGVCGGVIQNTPYIGHPAYKAMGGRAAYTLASGLFIGLGALVGLTGYLISVLPESVMVPILVFIGLEVCSQAYGESDKSHLAAVSICFVPTIANLVFIQYNSLMGAAGIGLGKLGPDFQETYRSVMLLGNGFVLTAMIWAAMIAFLTDDNFASAAWVAFIASVCAMTGFIHSPFPDGRLFAPWGVPATTYKIAVGYLLMGGIYLTMFFLRRPKTDL